MSEISDYLNDLFSGRKPIRRENPKPGQSGWYYMMPKSDDDYTDYDFIDVPDENSPNPRLQQSMVNQTLTPVSSSAIPAAGNWGSPVPTPTAPTPANNYQPQYQQETSWDDILRKAEYASTAAQQGLSLGWADEIEGAFGGLGYGIASLVPSWNKREESFIEAMQRGYTQTRDARRQNLEEGRQNAPILTGTAETVGALVSPVKLIKAAKTAPLSVQNTKRKYNTLADALVYGTGISENTPQSYAQNLTTSVVGNSVGAKIATKAIGQGYNYGRGFNAALRNGFNQGANNLTGWAGHKFEDWINNR